MRLRCAFPLHQVNAILSRAANNVLEGDVRRRLLLEMISACPGHGISATMDVHPLQTPEKTLHHNPQTGAVRAPVEATAPVRRRVGGDEGGHDSVAAHRQRLAGALEAAMATAGNGRAH